MSYQLIQIYQACKPFLVKWERMCIRCFVRPFDQERTVANYLKDAILHLASWEMTFPQLTGKATWHILNLPDIEEY